MARFCIAACTAVVLASLAHQSAVAAPLIRLGHANATEENLWLMDTPAGVTPNRGKAYEAKFIPFRSASDRFRAFEAGELDCGTGAAPSLVYAAVAGLKFKALASISKESSRGELSEFWVAENSPLKTAADVKGKLIGINGYKSTAEFWTLVAFKKNGLDPHRDVRYRIVSFPQMGDAIRAGQVDVGMLVSPFLSIEQSKGGVRRLFTSREGLPDDEDLTTIYCSDDFIKNNTPAVKAFLADFVATTKRYLADLKGARLALIEAKKVRIEPSLFLGIPDSYRDPDARLNVGDWVRMQDNMFDVGFIPKKIDMHSLIDATLLPSGK
jgi:ABC-type nitrate/sulfonate/bicarbonate transport system substrate-binding protein